MQNQTTGQKRLREEKEELLALLIEKQRRMAQDPLKYNNPYKPKRHEKQIEAHESMKPIRALFWGNRVGKSEWGAMETAYYLLGRHPYRQIENNIEVWCACPSFELQEETTQKKLLRYIPEDQIASADKIRGNILKNIVLKNGNRVTFKSYEQGREKFQGAGKRLIWFDEEPPSDIWEECYVRQEAGQKLDIILTMTPVNGMTWVYDTIYLNTSNKDIFISEASWDDNPYLSEEQKAIMARGIKTEEALAVRKEGRFISRVGLVCGWFRREKHLREYTEYPRDWAYYEGVDGGWSDPLGWLLFGVDPLGDVHVMDGFRKKELMTDEIIERRNKRTMGIVVRSGVSDNDNPRLIEELRKGGMNLQPVEKKANESASWDEARAERMANYGTIQKGTGLPRLYINKDLDWLVQEIENLKWLEVKRKEGQEIRPTWDDHRRFGHHWEGVNVLSYFLTQLNKPRDNHKNKQYNNNLRNKWNVGGA